MSTLNVTWDTVNKGSSVTFSNNNLTTFTPNYSNTARANFGKSSGKFYWEITLVSGYAMIGIVSKSESLTASNFSSNEVRYYYFLNGQRYPEATAYGTAYTNGDVIGIALDVDVGTITFYKNGVSQGISHSSMPSGELFPAVTSGSSSSGATFTANFGATPFAYTIPSGYKAYNNFNNEKFLLQSSSDEILSFVEGNDNSYSANLIPKMTSATAPSGKVEASSYYSSWYPYTAFNQVNTANGWMTLNDLNPWLSYEFPLPKIIAKYSLSSNSPTRIPKDWTFEGWNGTTWIVLDERVGVVDWITNTAKEFVFENTVAYSKYRINITQGNGGNGAYIAISGMQMMEVTVPKLISYPKTLSSPSSEQDFINHGLDDISIINLKENMRYKGYVNNKSTVLGSGKSFEHSVDLEKYKVKKIKFL